MDFEGMVEQIPFGLLAGELWNDIGTKKEVRIVKLSESGLVFRTAEPLEYEGKVSERTDESLVLHFFDEKKNGYQDVVLEHITPRRMSKDEKGEVFNSYFLAIENEDFRAQTRRLFEAYYRYINLKLCGDDAYLAKECVGYPAKEDEVFAANFTSQKLGWYQEALMQIKKGECVNALEGSPVELLGVVSNLELALELDNPKLYQEYLSKDKDSFFKEYWSGNGLAEHPFARAKWTRIYLGNQFCHNLFPCETQLFSILQKAKWEDLPVTIAFTYLREEYVEQTTQLLLKLYAWCKQEKFPCEVVIHDWGMAALLKGKEDMLTPILGVLLNKRRKDPRMNYKLGFQADAMHENAANNAFYQKYLKEQYGIVRYEYESCGYDFVVPDGHHSIHVPYFQTNTSQYCPLFARCVNGDRGNQTLVKNCPQYCRDFVFLYPEHLRMVGRYNSLFGYDKRALEEIDFWAKIRKSNIDRMVVNLM